MLSKKLSSLIKKAPRKKKRKHKENTRNEGNIKAKNSLNSHWESQGAEGEIERERKREEKEE